MVATNKAITASNLQMPGLVFLPNLRASDIRLLVATVLSLALGPSALAQATNKSTPQPPRPAAVTTATPSADQILNRYIEAMGGREAWKKLNSRVSIGTIEIPKMNLSGTIDFREKAPNRLLHTIVLNGATFRQGFDGANGWTDDPKDGVRDETGAELEDTRLDADFYHPLDLHNLYSKFTVTGAEKIGERNTYVVEAARAGAAPDKLYFDMQSSLVLRIVSRRHTSEGLMVYQEDLEDYREVDGIKLPFIVHQTTEDAAFTIQFAEVHHNVELDDQQFSKPAAQ
jgi:hypothetical protein